MNTIGRVFRCTTWGESHGEAIGCVIDGCPAGLELNNLDIIKELKKDIVDNNLNTKRKEDNTPRILSGIYNNKTLGTPICVVIFNNDCKSNDYEYLKYCYRPGHCEYGYHQRWGIYNPYGGGRGSGRTFIAVLAAGAVAKKLLSIQKISFKTKIEELAGISCDSKEKAEEAARKCLELSSEGDSTGGIFSLKIKNVPPGIGSPMFEKLHSLIMCTICNIGAVKGVECGLGFQAAKMKGTEVNDPFDVVNGKITPLTNNSGGVLGGISTGLDLIFRIAVKPTPSISLPQKTVNWKTKKKEKISINGRFDANSTARIAVVAEAMASLVLADQMILSGHIHPLKI